jgi:hypothetical protein
MEKKLGWVLEKWKTGIGSGNGNSATRGCISAATKKNDTVSPFH